MIKKISTTIVTIFAIIAIILVLKYFYNLGKQSVTPEIIKDTTVDTVYIDKIVIIKDTIKVTIPVIKTEYDTIYVNSGIVIDTLVYGNETIIKDSIKANISVSYSYYKKLFTIDSEFERLFKEKIVIKYVTKTVIKPERIFSILLMGGIDYNNSKQYGGQLGVGFGIKNIDIIVSASTRETIGLNFVYRSKL